MGSIPVGATKSPIHLISMGDHQKKIFIEGLQIFLKAFLLNSLV